VSRAFVKEPDGDEVSDDQPEIPESRNPNYVTPIGLAALKAALAVLSSEKEKLAVAEDLEAKLALAQTERRLRYVTHRIENAILVDPATQPEGEVAFGALVRVADPEGAEHEYAIVGEDEADVALNKVSWVSPLARALTGAKIGDVVTWKRPAGDVDLEILGIRYDTGKSR
jgi:transcription elongation factor GreB